MGATSTSVGLSLVFVRAIARALTELGLCGDDFLVALGVGAEAPDEEYVPTARVEGELRAIGERQNKQCIGLDIARETRVGGLGVFDYAVWTSASLRDALERWSEFFRTLTQSVSLDVEQRSKLAHVSVRLPRGLPPGTVLEDVALGAILLRAREMLGRPWRIESARFRHAATDHAVAE